MTCMFIIVILQNNVMRLCFTVICFSFMMLYDTFLLCTIKCWQDVKNYHMLRDIDDNF